MIATERLFRSTLLASIVLGIAGSTADIAFPQLIPQQLHDAHDALAAEEVEEYVPFYVGIGAAGVLLVLGGLAAAVGLWLFRTWAPVLAVCMTVLAYAIYPFLGHTLTSALASALEELSATLWGVVLALAYFSPLKQRFSRTEDRQP